MVNQRMRLFAGLVTGSGLLVIVLVSIVAVPRWTYPPLTAAQLRGVTSVQERIQLQQAQSGLADGARSAVLQSLAGLVVVAGAAATWRQVHISREGQITDRFTRAVDQLGSEKAEVRMGGIYALERIARNSAADRNAVQYLLGAFIRTRMPWPAGTQRGPEHPTAAVDEQLPWMRVRAPDIQAAIGALGRRPPSPDAQIVSLSRVDLRSIALRGSRLSGVRLRYANLARAVLDGVWLDGSDLTAIDLRRAFLRGAHLQHANLSRASLQDADLSHADLRQADLRGADLTGATLDGAIFTRAHADQSTTWPAGFDAGKRHDLGITEDSQNTTAPPAA